MDITQQLNAVKPKGVKWTLETFLRSAKIIHGDSYDYSKVTEKHMKTQTLLPLTCNICGYEWTPVFSVHINRRSKCRSCVGRASWTLERFIERSIKIYGPDAWDYSQINWAGKIVNGTRVYLVCKKCKNSYTPTIQSHISAKRKGCGKCILWTLEKVLTKAKSIHGDKYDYSNIEKDHIGGIHSELPIVCKTCNTKWFPTINNHIYGKSGCSGCVSSKGEAECTKILASLEIEFSQEYRLENYRKFYDFHFVHNSKEYLLEYDGVQHFKYSKYFHRSTDDFYGHQDVDISKTKTALENGFVLIRIDYTQLENIEYHINQALEYGFSLYVSNEEMYDYILSSIIDEQ